MAPTAVSAAGGGFGLEAVRSLSSVADVHRLLHEASARERAIDTELEQLLSKRSELEQGLLELHSSTEEVGTRPGWGECDPLAAWPKQSVLCWVHAGCRC
jgi:hypothetical protein